MLNENKIETSLKNKIIYKRPDNNKYNNKYNNEKENVYMNKKEDKNYDKNYDKIINDESNKALQSNTEKADAIFSIYIRLKYADENLDVKCFTCDKVYPYKKIQNGHFYSRGILSLRYDEQNCRPQCYGCNIARNGNYIEYYKRLLNEFPNYVGTYYHFGKLLEKKGETDEAIETYSKGMSIARAAGDQHSLSELAEAKLNLED
jgi:tetratricopeptide (TPR) repeat protein